MIKIIREDCQYFIEQMNKLLENENKGELRIVQEGGEDARKDINEIFSTWGKDEIYACTLTDQDSYQFDVEKFESIVRKAYIAKLGDNPVGFIFIEQAPDSGASVSIGVKSGEEFRNKKIASKLAAHLLDWFDSKSNVEYEHLYWGCLDTNVASAKVSEKFDFEDYATYTNYNKRTHNHDKIITKVRNKRFEQIPDKCLKGARLLTEDEFKYLVPHNMKCVYGKSGLCTYWLGDNYDNDDLQNKKYYDAPYTYCVDSKVCELYVTNDLYVRPILELQNVEDADIEVRSMVQFGDYTFKILADRIALCTGVVGKCVFNKDIQSEDAGNYKGSDAEKYVNNWFKETLASRKEKSKEK